MPGEMLVNAYIDANILLVVGFALWSLVLAVLVRTGLRRAYPTHLRLLNGVILAIAACPVLIYFLGGWSARHALNVSDIIVAQYLVGNVEINALQLETFLGLREDFVRGLVQLRSPLSWVVFAVAAAGFSVFTVKALHNALGLRQVLGNCRSWRRFGRIHLMLSDTALVPFSTRSLRRHHIVIPTVMLDNSADVRMAIGHELQHFRQRDVEWAVLLELLTPLFFWNPVFYLWKREVIRLRELSCDQNLVARNSYDVRAYCECLLRACQRSLRGEKNFTIVSPAVPLVDAAHNLVNCGSSRLLANRIIALTSGRADRASEKLFAFMIFPLVLTITLTALLIQRPADWSHDRLMLSTIINLERLDAHNTPAVLAKPDRERPL